MKYLQIEMPDEVWNRIMTLCKETGIEEEVQLMGRAMAVYEALVKMSKGNLAVTIMVDGVPTNLNLVTQQELPN